MSNIIRIKRRVSGAAGAPAGLKSAELAYNMADNTVYAGYGDDGSGNATAVKPIGGEGTFAKLDSPALTGTPTAPTPSGADNSTKIATTAFVKDQNYLTGNQAISLSGDVSGSGTTAITATLASVGTAGTYTKVTTDAKGRVTSGTTLSATDIPTLTSAKISDFDTQVRSSRLDQMAAPTAAVSLNAQKISNLADPTSAQDAATKAYVDATRQGLDVKESVRVATTASITLSANQTIDGVALLAGDRVLVKDQSTASANGIYVVAAGAWVRATDADSSAIETQSGSTSTRYHLVFANPIYRNDATAWCGLWMAYVALQAGWDVPLNPLAARNWLNFGQAVEKPALGDVLVFSWGSSGFSGHVGLYVGEDAHAFHVLGGNQSDRVMIKRIAKTRLLGIRRCPWRINQPAAVRPVVLSANGTLSTNEA